MIFGRQTPSPYEVRFWQRVDTSGGVTACWPWRGAHDKGGYGHFSDWNGGILAHRAAYQFAFGLLPKGLFVRHRCDNRACCNPLHHVMGTVQENNADMVRRGRQVRGERSGTAKMTAEIVLKARLQYECGASIHSLAEAAGVSDPAMHSAIRGESWAHVGGPIHTPRAPNPRILSRTGAIEVYAIYHGGGGVTMQELADFFHVSKATIKRVISAKGAYSFLAKEAA